MEQLTAVSSSTHLLTSIQQAPSYSSTDMPSWSNRPTLSLNNPEIHIQQDVFFNMGVWNPDEHAVEDETPHNDVAVLQRKISPLQQPESERLIEHFPNLQLAPTVEQETSYLSRGFTPCQTNLSGDLTHKLERSTLPLDASSPGLLLQPDVAQPQHRGLRATHDHVLDILKSLKGKEITCKIEYIRDNFDGGHVSFCPKGTDYRIRCYFRGLVECKGVRYNTLREEYDLRGCLIFNTGRLEEYVKSIPPENFLNTALQRNPENPINLDPQTIQVVRKSRHTALPQPDIITLSRQQMKIFDCISRYYNQLLTAEVIPGSIKTYYPKVTGTSKFQLQAGTIIFINFSIPIEKIQRINIYSGRIHIHGKLNYDLSWLISSIKNGVTLLHPPQASTPPKNNQIFFAPSTVLITA